MEPYTLEHAAAICDVPEATLAAARDAVVRGTRIGFASGTGASMSTAANITEWLGWVLCAVTGSLDRPGGTIFNPGVLKTAPTSRPATAGSPPPRSPTRSWAATRALFVMGGNPALVFPESERITRALREVELLIVCDIRHAKPPHSATW